MNTLFFDSSGVEMCWRVYMRWALLFLSMVCSKVLAQDRLDTLSIPRTVSHNAGALPSELEESSPNLMRQIGADFKNIFTTKENLITVAAGAGAAWGASLLDERIASSSLNSDLVENATMDNFFETGQHLGGVAQVAGAFAAYGLGRLLSKPGVEHLGRDLVRAQVVTQTFTFALKFAVARERPDGSDNRSFPSGHASGTFATATVLQRRYGWKIGVPSYAAAGYVACSRLNEGRHYLSDVVFGAALGITAGRTVTIDLTRVRFTVSPVPTSDGLQIQLRRL